MKADVDKSHIVIEHVAPQVDCGRYRAKAVTGDSVEVSADIFCFGTDVVQAVIRYRGPTGTRWSEEPMHDIGNDRFLGHFQPNRIGVWRYCIEAWTDHFATWRRDLIKRVDAEQDVDLELHEGIRLIEMRLDAVPSRQRRTLEKAVDLLRTPGPAKGRVKAALDTTVSRIMTRYPDRAHATTSPKLELTVDRERARFAAWYEFFPRSTGRRGEHGTFRTAAKALPRIADMGFDVVYLPPIHPIGTTNRKGKNNTLASDPSDVGVPWAIGSEEGGHKDLNPELGTIEDFDAFVVEAERLGLEVCLDFAIQCSPDHPWVKEHPEWFHHRPDGTIRYAENPPKKYEDIFPVNFDTEDKEGLWNELKSTLDHWIAHGVKIYRVDNPHTKPFPFWEWLINSIKSEHPDVIFLSEAFTRPKVMQNLAKLGFTQSYTYFTWRNAKWELEQYLVELTQTEMANYFRPNFFANTPDILHEYLQTGGLPAFKVRLVLAAFLSPSYGIYSGFELLENVPVREGSEEYLNSEKYELKHRDWAAQPNLTSFIAKINDIRHKHPPLSEFTNLRFHYTDKDNVMCFSKTSPGYDPILVVVTLNPFHWEEATVHLNLHELGLEDHEAFEVNDLVTDTTYVWHGSANYVRLDPSDEPAHIFRVRV
jgi:starch synthase (maltosyl-transferring)